MPAGQPQKLSSAMTNIYSWGDNVGAASYYTFAFRVVVVCECWLASP